MGVLYPEYSEWLSHIQRSMKLPKSVKLLFDQGRLYMAPVTEAHSEADDSIRGQLAEQLRDGPDKLHVTRNKGVLPERDGYTPEPDVLVVDAGALGPGDAFADQKHVYFVAERGIPVYLIVDVLTGECVLYQAPKHDEYTSAVPYRFGEAIPFTIAGVSITVRTDFKKIS
ncbi:PDDEXK family nuclease [Streptomyces chartreusis]|uniref:Uma2 family endonuclease n=1 Tax=Streptomyces chartreusis TaxID=1969 RepID=UPI0038138029